MKKCFKNTLFKNTVKYDKNMAYINMIKILIYGENIAKIWQKYGINMDKNITNLWQKYSKNIANLWQRYGKNMATIWQKSVKNISDLMC